MTGFEGPQATEHSWSLDGKDKEAEPPLQCREEELDLKPSETDFGLLVSRTRRE